MTPFAVKSGMYVYFLTGGNVVEKYNNLIV